MEMSGAWFGTGHWRRGNVLLLQGQQQGQPFSSTISGKHCNLGFGIHFPYSTPSTKRKMLSATLYQKQFHAPEFLPIKIWQ